MAGTNLYTLMISTNINGLSFPITISRLAEWIIGFTSLIKNYTDKIKG